VLYPLTISIFILKWGLVLGPKDFVSQWTVVDVQSLLVGYNTTVYLHILSRVRRHYLELSTEYIGASIRGSIRNILQLYLTKSSLPHGRNVLGHWTVLTICLSRPYTCSTPYSVPPPTETYGYRLPTNFTTPIPAIYRTIRVGNATLTR